MKNYDFPSCMEMLQARHALLSCFTSVSWEGSSVTPHDQRLHEQLRGTAACTPHTESRGFTEPVLLLQTSAFSVRVGRPYNLAHECSCPCRTASQQLLRAAQPSPTASKAGWPLTYAATGHSDCRLARPPLDL